MPIAVRPATEADLPALAALDLLYPTGRYLRIARSGQPPEHSFRLTWREREPGERLYSTYTVERLTAALGRAHLFLVAEDAGEPVGLLIALVPTWTDAAEITDLAVDHAARRKGAGRALVEAADAWARERTYRALWVEPRADNAEAIEFYLRLGFRVSGFNDRLYTNADDKPGEATVYMHLELPTARKPD